MVVNSCLKSASGDIHFTGSLSPFCWPSLVLGIPARWKLATLALPNWSSKTFLGTKYYDSLLVFTSPPDFGGQCWVSVTAPFHKPPRTAKTAAFSRVAEPASSWQVVPSIFSGSSSGHLRPWTLGSGRYLRFHPQCRQRVAQCLGGSAFSMCLSDWKTHIVRRPLKEAFLASKIVILD